MSQLDSFPENLNVVIVGASGAIGSECVRQLADDERVGRVHAFARNPVQFPGSKVIAGPIDICDSRSVDRAADTLEKDENPDLVIVATGILHRGDAVRPEKALGDIDSDAMAELFTVNAIGPALVARAFLPRMRRGSKAVFAALSARVGSIGDNRLGGWVSYRSSKAALNMILKTLSIEHARRFPDAIIAGLHPGTVDSALSAPFQRRVPEEKLFSPAQSVKRMLAVIDRLTPGDTGGFFAWDGASIEY
ncbi:MAG TPA: SDR family NAD(P)-dependent oxidoreductase [Woeseiaceae bacterium]|nr:SDR family NAD(P)-dependent oxidoreductase [Woeseiaceae bacterium]